MTPLHHSCNSSFEACVAKLIDAGADSNATDEEGNTCLHWAVSRGVLNIVVRLTNAGADISQSNNAGVTPLHKATIFNQVAVVKKLVDLGADVNATGKKKKKKMKKKKPGVVLGIASDERIKCRQSTRLVLNRTRSHPRFAPLRSSSLSTGPKF